MIPALTIAAGVAVLTLPAFSPFPGFGKPLFSTVSRPGPTLAQAVPVRIAAAEEPKIICRMPMIEGKSDLDPRIVVEPPTGIAFALRIIQAPGCR